jgi:hypothetical protein
MITVCHSIAVGDSAMDVANESMAEKVAQEFRYTIRHIDVPLKSPVLIHAELCFFILILITLLFLEPTRS